MTYLEAIVICKKLNTEEEELDCLVVGEAVQKILSMETINAVNKDTLLNIVRWCFPMSWEEVPVMNCTGERCIIQFDKVNPSTCKCVSYCPQATPPKTNADRIRSMSDEELAHFLQMEAGRFVSFYPTQAKSWLDWLKQEAKL